MPLFDRFRRSSEPATREPSPREWLGLVPTAAPTVDLGGAVEVWQEPAVPPPAPPLVLRRPRTPVVIEATPVSVTVMPHLGHGRYRAHRDLDLRPGAVDDTHAHIFNDLRRELVGGDA
jgi:hypothetical protein